MERGKYITIAIIVALVAVIYMSTTENTKNNPHPPNSVWLPKHKITVQRNGNPERFCLDCHNKRGETQEKFCDKCHAKYGIKKTKSKP